MKRTVLLALLLAGSVLAGSVGAQARWQEASYANIGGWQPVSSWCDTPERVLALTAPQGSGGPVELAQWVGGKLSVQGWQPGLPDPGAGQVYTLLTPVEQIPSPGQMPGQTSRFFVHSSATENTTDPQYRMTHINEYVVPAGRFQCRSVPQAAVLAATARHTVIVWEAGGRVTYASRNRDGTPGIGVTGGTHTRTDVGRERYSWNNAGYQYVLEVGQGIQPGGSLSVLKGERSLSREALPAYTISVQK